MTVSLFTNLNGIPTPTVTWTGPDNKTITTGGRFTTNAGSLSIADFTLSDNGTYTVTISNGIGTPLVNTIQLILAGMSSIIVLYIHILCSSVPPGPPIGLRVNDITDTSVRLEWFPPTNIGTPPLSFYWITIYPFDDVSHSTTNTSILVSGIIPGTFYNATVVAVAMNNNTLNDLLEGQLNTATFMTLLGGEYKILYNLIHAHSVLSL